MTPQIKVGNFTKGSGTGTLDVTDVGFQPDGLILFMLNDNGTNAIAGAFGAADGTNQFGTSFVGVPGPTHSRNSSTSDIIFRASTTLGTLTQAATLSSFLSNGFRLNFTTATGSIDWGYIAFKDCGMKVGNFSISGTGTLDVTDVGYTPSGGLIFWLPAQAAVTATMIGGFDEDLVQFASGGNNTLSMSANFSTLTEAILVATSTGGVVTQAAVTSLLSNGFRLNVTTGAGSQQFGYVTFSKAVKIETDLFQIASAATTFDVSALSFQPMAVLGMRHPNASGTEGINQGFGATDASFNQAASGTFGFNNTSGSGNVRRVQSVGNTFIRSSTSANVILAAMTAFDSDGFSGTVSTATANTNFDYFAIGLRKFTLSTNDLAHANALDASVLTQKHTVSLADLIHNNSLDGFTVTQKHNITVADLLHGHDLDEVGTLVQDSELVIADLLHNHELDAVELIDGGFPVPEELLHLHVLENVTLTQRHYLSVDDVSHGNMLDNTSLVQKHTLETNNLSHGHVLDAITLTQKHILAVSDALHAQTIEDPTLFQRHVLELQEALHEHTLDQPFVFTQLTLVMQSMRHGHTTDSVTILIKVKPRPRGMIIDTAYPRIDVLITKPSGDVLSTVPNGGTQNTKPKGEVRGVNPINVNVKP